MKFYRSFQLEFLWLMFYQSFQLKFEILSELQIGIPLVDVLSELPIKFGIYRSFQLVFLWLTFYRSFHLCMQYTLPNSICWEPHFLDGFQLWPSEGYSRFISYISTGHTLHKTLSKALRDLNLTIIFLCANIRLF